MAEVHYISADLVDLKVIREILRPQTRLMLSEESKLMIKQGRTFLDDSLKKSGDPYYGINTGFGALHQVKISQEHLTQLQENLVKSHACGTGAHVPKAIIRLMLFLKVQSLAYGHSGIELSTIDRLIQLYNEDVLPVVYEQGSLGASGDLAPLAHLSLPLIGQGEVHFRGSIRNADEINAYMGWNPLKLQSKEGLALLNGTQFMTAYGIYALLWAVRLSYMADVVSALSLDAFGAHLSPFSAELHELRPHPGQIKTAQRIVHLLEGSELQAQQKSQVQDPYSFRCIPQVHGASKDTLRFAYKTLKIEMNSVTDNPIIFPESNQILSGGNFHGQPLALAMDYMGIAMAELGSISERRIFQLVSGQRGLPAFLVDDPGLNSGFMIPQYVAAAVVSENKQLATPASVDSIVSSNGQEDHVSMGANAATKLLRILENTETVLAIELLNASQALHFRNPLKTSPRLEDLLFQFRKFVPFIKQDQVLQPYIQKSKNFIQEVELPWDELVERSFL